MSQFKKESLSSSEWTLPTKNNLLQFSVALLRGIPTPSTILWRSHFRDYVKQVVMKFLKKPIVCCPLIQTVEQTLLDIIHRRNNRAIILKLNPNTRFKISQSLNFDILV